LVNVGNWPATVFCTEIAKPKENNMKKRNLLAAALLITSLGVTSCASDEEKREKEQRMEETVEAEQERMEEFGDEMEEEVAQAEENIEDSAQQMQDDMSDKPWADQRISLDRAKEVQEALKNNGYQIGSVDGLIGPKTMEGLKSFQEQHENLTASGELNQETIDALGLDFNLVQAQQEPSSEMAE
tara:strand:- start:112 stop:666 length:555 start_codon:yes stop_codon:yes gene_type:complete